jgi:hypothetical protein
VISRCGKFFVVIMLVLTTGFQWTATLQLVAWATMLTNNLRTHSVTEAVSQTFDGQHPCCMCRAIAAAKKAQKKSEAVTSTLKFEYLLPADKIIIICPKVFSDHLRSDISADSFFTRPPVPPPRSSLV